MQQIDREGQTSRKTFRFVVVAAAAAVVAIAGVAVIALAERDDTTRTTPPASDSVPDRSLPDRDEAARAERNIGVAPSLDADVVDCFTKTPPWRWSEGSETPNWNQDSIGVETSLSEGATAKMMADRCIGRLFYPAEPEGPVETHVCAPTSGFPTAVVALDGATCADAAADRNVGLRPLTDADLTRIDHMRGVEVAFLANPKKCASSDEVRDWVLKVLAQEKVELRIDVRAKPYPERDTGFANVPECGSIPSVDWRTDTVKVVHFVDVDPSSAET